MDEKQLSKTARIPMQAARIALNDAHWKKWLSDKEEERDAKSRLANLRMVSGFVVQDKPMSDKDIIAEMYEGYLRMAQLDQRSKYTFVVDNGGKRSGKRILDMTFDEYVRDGNNNLDWIEYTDIPMLLRIEERGGIGTTKKEAEFTLQLVKRMREAIARYLSIPEEERQMFVE